MKFLCDAMLGHLGRRLRSAGYDTMIEDGTRADGELVALAAREGRILMTCDRGIVSSRARVLQLSTSDERAWARFLASELSLDWTLAPFTRCLECNGELILADAEALRRIPKRSRRDDETPLYCPECHKVYWFGSHVARMRLALERLKALSEAPGLSPN